MPVPLHLLRFQTTAAKVSLAARFGLPNGPRMQDWAWEVADPARIDEFLAAYEHEPLSDDERFCLMEILLQSFEDLGGAHELDARWKRVLALLDRRIDLHVASVWYWSRADESDGEDFEVTPSLRALLSRHRERFERPGTSSPT